MPDGIMRLRHAMLKPQGLQQSGGEGYKTPVCPA